MNPKLLLISLLLYPVIFCSRTKHLLPQIAHESKTPFDITVEKLY